MKNSDISTLEKVLLALEKYLPPSEKTLLDEYFLVFERFNDKNEREKQAYQDKAEYHREYTRTWKEENPDKQKHYDRVYQTKKRQQKKTTTIITDVDSKRMSFVEKIKEKQRQAQQQSSETDSADKKPRKKTKEPR